MMRAVISSGALGPLSCVPAAVRFFALPTDSSRQQITPSAPAPGEAPAQTQVARSPLAEMNPGVHKAARDKNDYTQAMEEAYRLSAAGATAAPPAEVGTASDVAPGLRGRAVTIVAAGRSRMANSPKWNVRFNPLQKWTNPVMGWTSTGDPMEACPEAALWFYTQEQAARFCERQGWAYEVSQEQGTSHGRQKRFAAYGDNFTVKRGGVPDLTHLPSNAAAKHEPGPAAAQAAGRPGGAEAGPTARRGGGAVSRG
ncbi:MAG: ETC complex I subunit conserved region-domain-containing protein [Monoraphidium minutum]|nr:MAG: ETC complex I subunit conserved region-domain-containing protein [Monoraphidium minutum]